MDDDPYDYDSFVARYDRLAERWRNNAARAREAAQLLASEADMARRLDALAEGYEDIARTMDAMARDLAVGADLTRRWRAKQRGARCVTTSKDY